MLAVANFLSTNANNRKRTLQTGGCLGGFTLEISGLVARGDAATWERRGNTIHVLGKKRQIDSQEEDVL
jgi:hypothetical protein